MNDASNPRPSTRTAAAGLLRASGLTKTYATGTSATTVLHGIDVDVAPGEFLTVMGPSGSGKSTLLYCLSGLDRPTEGAVALEGTLLTSLDDESMARLRLTRMGFVFQQPYFLDSLSIRDNILLPALKAAPSRAEERDVAERVDALMERFGITATGAHAISAVSGGQLQRAALCRALATRPSVLFADEPTGALNHSMSLEVMSALTEAHRAGTTIVMVTHSPALATRADRILYIADGTLTDTLTLGRWTEGEASSRENTVRDWLREKGY
ncbi:ABC transporter ATP-binding protein [Homoserinibacter sp. YIM 151385]|uniref:ABC transporter ATP-binding protein n=1 Tax=Homoserinibacter sp. YIM 151385 TaxID=2985506 RepID=UPI0022F13E8F|nr:ABC transporter ATP-binding protein [Homoserinibacter sp. YIM 151385]WBU38793.1 ABC transporter ATP-binding protein [Homoserinibacter sp. YIM 151385]